MANRVSKTITDQALISNLLSLKSKDITASYIYDLFGEFNGVTKCYPYDILNIPANAYGPEGHKNKNSFVTTAGIWVMNKWLFEESGLFNLFHYINENFTSDTLDGINKELSFALMEDRISVQDMKDYLMKTQLVMQFCTVFSPNYTEATITLSKIIEKKKDKLIKENKEALEMGDTLTADKIEKELINYAMEVLGDDPFLDTFLSGARGNIKNNFKNMFIWKGATRNPDPNAKNPFMIATSNYMDGIKPEEYSLYCNSGIEGAYSRGKKTEDGGYLENLATRAYQDIVLDKPGTDCKTDRCIKVTITEKNFTRYIYNNIVSSTGKLIELTSQNAKDYFGKTVKMRMAYLCKNERPCAACAGNFYYKLGTTNVGLTLMQVFSIFKNRAMKAFHDSTVSLTEIDTMKAFGLK